MKRVIRIAFEIAMVCAALSVAAPLAAHHSFAGVFDAGKVLNIKGVVTRFDWVNPHSYIYLDSTSDGGAVEHWALEGPSVAQLKRKGVNRMTLNAGDMIEVCGYGTKEGVKTTKIETPGNLESRIVYAESVTLPEGKKLTWSDYGQRKCLDGVRVSRLE